MSFLKKAMATMGIGGAKVNTVLDYNRLEPGAMVRGHIVVMGGSVEQQVDNVYLKLNTEYKRERDDKTYYETATVQRVTIPVRQAIGENQRIEIPFEFMLDYRVPVTHRRSKVWLSTVLDIASAVDSTDRDYIEVVPHRNVAIILDAIQRELRFNLREIENEYYRYGNGVPFIQEFEFTPTDYFRRSLDELEVVFEIYEGGVQMFMEIDKRARGFGGLIAEAFDFDEKRRCLNLGNYDLSQGPRYIAGKISEFLDRNI